MRARGEKGTQKVLKITSVKCFDFCVLFEIIRVASLHRPDGKLTAGKTRGKEKVIPRLGVGGVHLGNLSPGVKIFYFCAFLRKNHRSGSDRTARGKTTSPDEWSDRMGLSDVEARR